MQVDERKSNYRVKRIEPVRSFEITPETLSGNQGETKNINIKQYLCVRPLMPASRLTHVILHENLSHQRMLDMQLDSIAATRKVNASAIAQNRRTFINSQNKKQNKWKREDEERLSSMNLPMLLRDTEHRPKSMKVVYTFPAYESDSTTGQPSSSLPKMPVSIRRERTEIVTHKDKTFLTRLPEMVVVDEKKLERHNTYCGITFQDKSLPGSEQRFKRLHSSLLPAKLKPKDTYPLENLICKSRWSKYQPDSPKETDDKWSKYQPHSPSPAYDSELMETPGQPNDLNQTSLEMEEEAENANNPDEDNEDNEDSHPSTNVATATVDTKEETMQTTEKKEPSLLNAKCKYLDLRDPRARELHWKNPRKQVAEANMDPFKAE